MSNTKNIEEGENESLKQKSEAIPEKKSVADEERNEHRKQKGGMEKESRKCRMIGFCGNIRKKPMERDKYISAVCRE